MRGTRFLDANDWTVGVRVWVERGGRPLVGKGRVELLEGIGRHRSISLDMTHTDAKDHLFYAPSP
jgi:hypothetical protein